MQTFERYLSLWVLACIAIGIGLGALDLPVLHRIATWEWNGVHVVIAVLIWAMVFPMMLQVDPRSIRSSQRFGRGLAVTLAMNWLVKPFTMALFAWIFYAHVLGDLLPDDQIDSFIAGAILLGAAPCTAMVFVWSYLSDGDATYTLAQVTINDLVLLVAFAPIVRLLLGVQSITVPFDVLLTSVAVFVALPLVAGISTRTILLRRRGDTWFRDRFLPALRPVSITALLLTLILLFTFQGDRILERPGLIVLLAIPLIIQTYVIFALTYGLGRWVGLPYATCAPSSLIGASNFFELAVAVAIMVFGIGSGAALVTVVGVLIEVPIMLSLVRLVRRWRSAPG